jgi:hypothetical protein
MEEFKFWITDDRVAEQQQAEWLRADSVFDQVELALGEFKRTDDADEYTVEHPDLANLAVYLLCAPTQSATCVLIGGFVGASDEEEGKHDDDDATDNEQPPRGA